MSSQLSQMSIFYVWVQGDAVTRTVALILLFMSVVSWIVLIVKALSFVRLIHVLRSSPPLEQSLDVAHGATPIRQDDPFQVLVRQGLDAVALYQSITSSEHAKELGLSQWLMHNLRHNLREFGARLQTGLSVLASIGSTAPFIGLFGTVWGIYHALTALDGATEATLGQIAGPVGETLVMTALGLAVAIPAVLGYNTLVRSNKYVLARLGGFAHRLHTHLLTRDSFSSQPALVFPISQTGV